MIAKQQFVDEIHKGHWYCPKCKSVPQVEDTQIQNFFYKTPEVIVVYSCTNCDKWWEEVYKFNDVRPLN